jgi:hypothetical protein
VLTLDTTWENRGVGRAMRDYHLVVTLYDASGKLADTRDIGPLPTSKWIKGRQYLEHSKTDLSPPAGTYQLFINLRDDDGREIHMPLRDESDGGYPIGSITVP